MGFGDHCLTRDCGQQDAASELPVLHRDTMQGFQCRVDCCVLCSGAAGGWAGQRSSGVQEVGPLTPPPSPPQLTLSPKPAESWEGFEAGTHNTGI